MTRRRIARADSTRAAQLSWARRMRLSRRSLAGHDRHGRHGRRSWRLRVELDVGPSSTARNPRRDAGARLHAERRPRRDLHGARARLRRRRGIHLHVIVPSASTDAIKLLETGRADFAILDIHDLAIARERGQDIVGIMPIVQRPLAAVIAAPQVQDPRSSRARPSGVTGDPSDTAVLDSIVAGAGGDPSRSRRSRSASTRSPTCSPAASPPRPRSGTTRA